MNYRDYIMESARECFREYYLVLNDSTKPIPDIEMIEPPQEKRIKIEKVPLRRSARLRANAIISDPTVKENTYTNK